MTRKFSDAAQKNSNTFRNTAFIDSSSCTSKSLSDLSPKDIEQTRWVDVDGTLGYVKRRGCDSTAASYEQGNPKQNLGLAKEKIIADLGHDLDVATAPGTLIKHDDQFWFVSLYPFEGEVAGNFSEVISKNPKEFNKASSNLSSVLDNVVEQNTALWVFHTWTGDYIEHSSKPRNFLLNQTKDRYALASIDHAEADLAVSDTKGAVSLTQKEYMGPFHGIGQGHYSRRDKMPVAPYDPETLEKTVKAIKSYPVEKIEKIVNRIPDTLITDDDKALMIGNLIEGQSKLSDRMTFLTEKLSKEQPLKNYLNVGIAPS